MVRSYDSIVDGVHGAAARKRTRRSHFAHRIDTVGRQAIGQDLTEVTMRELETRIAIAARAAALLILSLGPVDRALAQPATPTRPNRGRRNPRCPRRRPRHPPGRGRGHRDGPARTAHLRRAGRCHGRDARALFPRGQRTNDLPTTSAPGQAITATVPVGFYDAQAIRERRGEVAGLRWAEQLLVQRYPDEYGRHLEVINFKPGYGALQIRPSPDAAAAAKGWTAAAYASGSGETAKEAGKAVIAGEDLLFALPAGSYDVRLTMSDKSTQWMRDIEVPADRTRLKTWSTGASSR